MASRHHRRDQLHYEILLSYTTPAPRSPPSKRSFVRRWRSRLISPLVPSHTHRICLILLKLRSGRNTLGATALVGTPRERERELPGRVEAPRLAGHVWRFLPLQGSADEATSPVAHVRIDFLLGKTRSARRAQGSKYEARSHRPVDKDLGLFWTLYTLGSIE